MQGNKISVEIRLSRVGYFRLMSTVIKEIIYMMKDFFFSLCLGGEKGGWASVPPRNGDSIFFSAVISFVFYDVQQSRKSPSDHFLPLRLGSATIYELLKSIQASIRDGATTVTNLEFS